MWSEGDVIVRREVLNDGRAWLELPVVVVRDEPELLATYVAEGRRFTFRRATGPPRTAGIHGTGAPPGRAMAY